MSNSRGAILMVGEPLADAAIFFAVFLLSALVSSIEAAIQSISRQQLEARLALSDLRAGIALKLKSRAELLRAATTVIVVFALVFAVLVIAPYIGTALAWLVNALHAGECLWEGAYELILILAVAALTASAYLVFITLVARTIGHNHALSLSLHGARTLDLLTRIASIPANGIIGFANFFLNGSGREASFIDSVMSEEGLKDILEEGTKSGIIDRTEHELIESIFDFTETTAHEIMVPRTGIVAIELGMSADRILQVVIEEGFTRMPVYKESIDNIVGVVYAKDVLSLVQHSELIILVDIIRPPYFVPESKPIPELLRDFQRKRQHLAIVVDEFGGTEGLITMEDILEEIVGEIQDEYDEEELLVEKMGDGTLVVQAKLNISEFNDISDFHLPESEDYDTVGGFVTALFGRIPGEGEEIGYHDIRIHVHAVDERRIVSIWIWRLPADEGEIDE